MQPTDLFHLCWCALPPAPRFAWLGASGSHIDLQRRAGGRSPLQSSPWRRSCAVGQRRAGPPLRRSLLEPRCLGKREQVRVGLSGDWGGAGGGVVAVWLRGGLVCGVGAGVAGRGGLWVVGLGGWPAVWVSGRRCLQWCGVIAAVGLAGGGGGVPASSGGWWCAARGRSSRGPRGAPQRPQPCTESHRLRPA